MSEQKHTPITDAQLDKWEANGFYRLATVAPLVVDDLREARRILRQQARHGHIEVALDADTELGRYLAACGGSDE